MLRYTGHDLLNPSCWKNPTWHPTVFSGSFVSCEHNINLDGTRILLWLARLLSKVGPPVRNVSASLNVRKNTFRCVLLKVLYAFTLVCNTPKKCVFTRVVDSCAGCAKGSKHVDLTKNAFSGLADLEQGLLTVQMRPATNPEGWYVQLIPLSLHV